jgi:hypothetical protein
VIGRTLGIALLGALGCIAQERTSTLVGTVTDFLASPIPNTTVRLEPEEANGPSFSVKTGTSGQFRFADIPPAKYHLVLQARFFVGRRIGIQLSPGQQQSLPNLVLNFDMCSRGPLIDSVQRLKQGDDSGTLRGSVLDGSGSPISEAIVSLNCFSCVTKTNQAGDFTFANLKPGSYVLAISKAGYYHKFLPQYGVFKNLDWTYAPIELEPCPAEGCERTPQQAKIIPGCA